MKEYIPGCFHDCNLIAERLRNLESLDTEDPARDLLHKVVDGQASESELLFFEEAVTRCHDCKCRIWKEEQVAVKEKVKDTLGTKDLPVELLSKIRKKLDD